jgi:hypothetical protein
MVGDDLVIFGGYYNDFALATNQTYARNVVLNNGTNAWRRMEDQPISIGITHTPTAAVGSKVYLCGGYLGRSPGPHLPDCYVYGTGQWSKIQDLPLGGTGGAGMIYDAQTRALYYVGGALRPNPDVFFSNDTNRVWKYSLTNTTLGWVASTPIPYLANHMSYVTARDASNRLRHYFLGGQVGDGQRLKNMADVFEFKPRSATWFRRSSMPFGRGHASASTRAIGCGFIIAGGAINAFNLTSGIRLTMDVSYYDIPTNTWTFIGNVSRAIVTPVVVIDRIGYMHFIDPTRRSVRRKITI